MQLKLPCMSLTTSSQFAKLKMLPTFALKEKGATNVGLLTGPAVLYLQVDVKENKKEAWKETEKINLATNIAVYDGTWKNIIQCTFNSAT